MHDINRIKDLLAQQNNLNECYEELDAILDDLKSLRNNQEFIPQSINSSICTMLTRIQRDQDTFQAGYKALDLGPTPSSVSECGAELADYEKYIIEKSCYVDIINFVLSLDSDNAAAKTALEQHKDFAASYDCRTNSVAQCENDLKKYILLKKAFEEADPTKRLSDIIELSPLIDFPLVVALNTNALTSNGKSSALQEEPVVQKEPVVQEPVVQEEPLIQKEPVIQEAIVIPEITGSEFKVQQKKIADRPAPDEAPVSHHGIESGLNAELTQVLSRETAAASLAKDVEHTSSLPRINVYTPGRELQDPWGDLGIYNPAAVCYSVPDERMRMFRCEKPKKFSVSDFNKEMSLKSPNRFQKQWAFKDAYRYGATSPRMLAELIKEDPAMVEEACNTLVNNGYLKAFELAGPAFDQFDRLYVLTASGRKVFTNVETAAVLNLSATAKAATPPFASHANAVLNRQLFLKSKKLMEIYMPSRQFNVGSFILETNSFINFFPTTNGSGTYAYVSVIGDEVKDYLIFKIELQEMLPSLNTITIVSMTREHGKALTDWVYDSFSKALSGKKLQYYVCESDTYYSYPEGLPFKIS